MDICDDYEHPDPNLIYIIENCPYEPLSEEARSEELQSLEDLCNSVLENPCECVGTSCGSKEGCHHGGNYQVLENQKTTELVLNKSRKGGDLIYECFQFCSCPLSCPNRLLQFGPRRDLKIISTCKKGKGLITTKPIPEGAFICEYAGEILTKSEAEKRVIVNSSEGKPNYIMCLNESPDLLRAASREGSQLIQTFIDPSKKGNIGRYLNHSCNANCDILSVRVDSPIPKIGIFAKRDITAFEELCFHYGPSDLPGSDDKKPCYCGAQNCQQFLPSIRF